MLGKFLGKVTGKSVEVVTATPEFLKTNTKATMEALKSAKDGLVTDFKAEFKKPEVTNED